MQNKEHWIEGHINLQVCKELEEVLGKHNMSVIDGVMTVLFLVATQLAPIPEIGASGILEQMLHNIRGEDTSEILEIGAPEGQKFDA